MSPKYWALLTPIAITMPAYSADYLTEVEAKKILFPDADEFITKNMKLSEGQLSKIKELSGVRQRNEIPTVVFAKKKGKDLGLFFIDDVVGKHEFITYAAAVDPEGKVIGIEIMIYRETHGGEIRQESWRKHFKGKTISNPFKLDQDVPNITGATLSCRNVLDGVKRLLAVQRVINSEPSL